MPLADVLNAIGAGLAPEILFQGPDDNETHDSPQRISWEPGSARHRPPERLQGGAGKDGDLWLRELSVNVRIWGRTHEETEAMLVSFVNLAHEQLFGAYRLDGEVWSHGGTAMNAGYEVTLTLVLFIPLPRRARPTRPLTQINATPVVRTMTP